MEDCREPLLELSGFEGNKKRWWKKVLDMEESKLQLLFSLPLILTNVFYYMITLVSVMFAGHLGELELAAATLANTLASVTGFALMVSPFLSLFFSLSLCDFMISGNVSLTISFMLIRDEKWKKMEVGCVYNDKKLTLFSS